MDFNLSEEEDIIQSTIRDLAQNKFKPRSEKIDHESQFPEENLKELSELGLMGSIIDETYGGAGASTLSYSLILEEIAQACASTSVITSVTTMVGLAIQRAGSEDQKQKYIPQIADGSTLGAFCLTEPGAGSDAAAIKTTAKLEGDNYLLDGQKLWITNAAHSDIFLVMANEDPAIGRKGISAFVVEKSKVTEGKFTIGPPEKKMGLNGSHTCAIFFDNVHIPKENRIGTKGEGLGIALKSLDTGRIGIASQALGIGQAAFDASLDYAKERHQFGKSIGKFQGISFKIAEMKMKLDTARLVTRKAAWMKDQGMKHTMESSIAKAYATEAAFDITAQAIRVHGGMGFSKELPLERYHRDIQATLIYEGTNEIQRLVISRNLGL
ncbi:MAG: acyl-CoA dehydrogenase [Candidatus Heimdallarchaeota archaeon]|nr:acyl-CoA dehydrogenase [Candidatus Heimdallarchaeota archaeon]